jgi:hypothetical protein
MKGDFGRIRFNRGRQYTAVLQQQGRVALDSDANEQSAIYEYLRRTEIIDVIGKYGGPMDDEGFAITIQGNTPQNSTIAIGSGRYYVAGLLCENLDSSLTYNEQRFFANPPVSDTDLLQQLLQQGPKYCIQVFLEAWQRLVTALDDPCLSEPALGQADTTARVQTVWRVVALLAETDPAGSGCYDQMYKIASETHTGTLSAQTTGGGADCGCQPVSTAGYRGLENQLYRVEIHRAGNQSEATFKWSRENGSVVTAIQSISGATVTVASLGPDANLGFQPGQWVELTDDSYLFGKPANRPGQLYQILSIDAPSGTVTMTTTVLPVDPTLNARMRRWDQVGSAATATGVALSSAWIDLENGIQVRFGSGEYTSGDAWVIPARTATGQVEWPPCGGDGKAFQPPMYAHLYTAPLACIHVVVTPTARARGGRTNIARQASRFRVEDCRRPFPALTELNGLGDQQALHVTGISWLNDDVMTLDALIANGLTVTFDTAPDGLVTPANFVVTLETPIESQTTFQTVASGRTALAAIAPVAAPAGPAGVAGAAGVGAGVGASATPTGAAAAVATPAADAATATAAASTAAAAAAAATATRAAVIGTSLGSRASAVSIRQLAVPAPPTPTTLRSETILDSSIQVQGTSVAWTMPFQHVSGQQLLELFAIDVGLFNGLNKGLGGPGRVRVKLAGRTLSAAVGPSQLYLDGQTFSQVVTNSSGQGQRVDLQFPSGNNAKGSDFESWFYLYPILSVVSLQPTYTALTVTPSVTDTPVITQTTPPATTTPIVQLVTVTLLYPAAQAGTIALSLTGDTTIANLPASVPFNAGDSGVSVPVSITAVPGNITDTFTVTASLTNALGFSSSATATFTITGVIPLE